MGALTLIFLGCTRLRGQATIWYVVALVATFRVKGSVGMRFLVPILLIIVSILHSYLVVAWWPYSLVSISAPASQSSPAPLLNVVLGFVGGGIVFLLGSMVRAGNLVGAAWTIVVAALGIGGYLLLPLPKVFVPEVGVALVFGVLLGVSVAAVGSLSKKDLPLAKPLSLVTIFCLVFNLLLLIAPSCAIFPTGFAGDVNWAIDTLILRHEDSVSVHNNLLFIIIRSILDPVVGESLTANSFVSLMLSSLGLSLLVAGVQIAAGPGLAILVLFFMVTEGWVLVTSYSANLVASLITTCGVLFYVVMRVGFDTADRTRRWHGGTFGLLVLATLLGFYSYAAVRMPFVFSIGCIAFVYLLQAEGSLIKRALGAIIWVGGPVAAALTLMTIFAYKGNVGGLQHDLLVSWPKDAVMPNPGAEGIHNYVLVRNFDTPLWQQIARPADGTNKSVIWTRTPLETLQAFSQHLSDIAANIPRFFFIQPLPFFLCILGLCAIPVMPRKTRLLYAVCSVWSLIWLSTYLLVPDPSAFRRAVAFPGCLAIILVLAFAGLFNSRRGGWIPEARMRMFTLCATAPAHRALLMSPLIKDYAKSEVVILPNGINGGKEKWCFDDAISSTEWRRLLPNTNVVDAPAEQGLSAVTKIPPGRLVIAYCNFESQRAGHVASLCKGEVPGFVVVGEVPNAYDGGHWVLLTNSVNS